MQSFLIFFFVFRFFAALKRTAGAIITISLFLKYDPMYPAAALYNKTFLVSVNIFFLSSIILLEFIYSL